MNVAPPESHSPLFHRIGRLRWQAAFFAFSLVLIHQWIEHAYLFFLPRWTHFFTQVLFYGIVGPIVAWLGLTSLRNQVVETELAEQETRRSRDELAKANRRLEFLIEVERRLTEAETEAELVSALVELPHNVVPTLGVSLIRYDNSGNPLPAHHRGQLSPDEFEKWSLHLATREPGHSCPDCLARRVSTTVPCPLAGQHEIPLEIARVFDLSLARGDEEFGTLYLYLADQVKPSLDEEGLLRVMAASMSLVLESQLLRTKELNALHRLHDVRREQDLEGQFHLILKRTIDALELDGGALYSVQRGSLQKTAYVQDPPGLPDEFLNSMASAAEHSDSAFLAGDLKISVRDQLAARSMLVIPLRKEAEWLGSMILWSDQNDAFSPRQIRIIEFVASQATLLLEIHQLYRQVEFRAGLAERARLAREIHDGLAQTLGYLKLRLGQLIRWQEAGMQTEVGQALPEVQRQIDEAFTDARAAIDGLRMDPRQASFSEWLGDLYRDVERASTIKVQAKAPPEVDLPVPVKSQLLRIIQEALGNVRKHASAANVWVDWQLDNHFLTLRVRDDGRGFDPEGVPFVSQHGLRIMRERAELLGADFQLSSQPDKGCLIEVRLPLAVLGREEEHD
jgi:two-component system nitrate/nitrite sensor histidine kinase NarX